MNDVLGHLCAHNKNGLNWARRTPWRWCNEWADTALQTQYSKIEAWRPEAEHTASQSRRLPTIMNLYEWAGKKHLVSLKFGCQSGHAALATTPRPPPPNRRYKCLKHPPAYACTAWWISKQWRIILCMVKSSIENGKKSICVWTFSPTGMLLDLGCPVLSWQ